MSFACHLLTQSRDWYIYPIYIRKYTHVVLVIIWRAKQSCDCRAWSPQRDRTPCQLMMGIGLRSSRERSKLYACALLMITIKCTIFELTFKMSSDQQENTTEWKVLFLRTLLSGNILIRTRNMSIVTIWSCNFNTLTQPLRTIPAAMRTRRPTSMSSSVQHMSHVSDIMHDTYVTCISSHIWIVQVPAWGAVKTEFS